MSDLQLKNVLSKFIVMQPRLVVGANVLLVLAIAYAAAQLTWRLAPEPEALPLPPMAPIKVSNSASAPQSASLSQLLPSWHLFGEVQKEQVVAPKQEVIPETKLNLTLRGLLASDNPEEGGAIIADGGKQEKFYRIGAALPGGAVLAEIHADRVVLERRGRFETLRLPKETLDMGGEPSTTSAGVASSSSSGPTYSSTRNNYSGGKSLASYREELISNPQKISDLVTISPVRKRGKFVGYSLRPGKEQEMMAQYGLQSGDIVTSINGVVLDSPTKGLGVLRDLATADTLELEIERGGRKQYITVPVN